MTGADMSGRRRRAGGGPIWTRWPPGGSGAGNGLSGHQRVAASQPGRAGGGGAGDPATGVRTQPSGSGIGDPSDRRGGAGDVRVPGAVFRRAVLRRDRARGQCGAAGHAAAAVLMMAQSPPERERLGISLTTSRWTACCCCRCTVTIRCPAGGGAGGARGRGRPAGPGRRTLPRSGSWTSTTAGCRRAVEHLIAPGRRRIATIAGPPDMARREWRGWPAGSGPGPAGGRPRAGGHGDFGEASGAAGMRRCWRVGRISTRCSPPPT